MIRNFSLPRAVVLLAALPLCAFADIQIYTDRDAFLAALQTSYVETFSGVDVGVVASPLPLSGGGFTYDIASSLLVAAQDIDGDRSVRATATNRWLVAQNFTGGVNAVGGYFFLSEGTTLYTSGTLGFFAYNGVDPDVNVYLTAPLNATTFVGAISTVPLVSIATYKFSGPGGLPTMDDLILGVAKEEEAAAVPEPVSLSLLGAALGVTAWKRRSFVRPSL